MQIAPDASPQYTRGLATVSPTVLYLSLAIAAELGGGGTTRFWPVMERTACMRSCARVGLACFSSASAAMICAASSSDSPFVSIFLKSSTASPGR